MPALPTPQVTIFKYFPLPPHISDIPAPTYSIAQRGPERMLLERRISPFQRQQSAALRARHRVKARR